MNTIDLRFDLVGEMLIAKYCRCLESLKLLSCKVFHFVHLLYQRYILHTPEVVIEAFLERLLIADQLVCYSCFPSRNDYDVENDNRDHNYCRCEVCPNIDTLVVHHEQASYDFFGGIEIYSIAMCNCFVVFHKTRRFLVMANEMVLLVRRFPFRL